MRTCTRALLAGHSVRGLLLLACLFPAALCAEVWIVPIQGAIGPATSDFYIRSLNAASSAGAEAVVVTLDTPGGLDNAMRDMIKATLGSAVPVIIWVTPQGARAASAGTYLLYAAHVAAMSPATNVGSSTPVSLTGPISPPRTPTPTDGDDETPLPADSDMRRKVVNDAVGYIRSLAELRGRNAEWAELSVREGANLSARAALDAGVVDLISSTVDELLAAVDGREIVLGNGSRRILQTAGVGQRRLEPDWRHRFLNTITNPNIAYLLLMIGLYGLILEFYNPGMGAPGIVGVICLLLGAYALQMLPVNYVGLGLIAFGILLMIAEAMAPSFGILGLGGVIAFLVGSVVLFDSDLPGFRVSLYMIAVLGIVAVATFFVALGALMRSRRQPALTGPEGLIGVIGSTVGEVSAERGHVHIHGENWQARLATDRSVPAGTRVRVVDLDGLTLVVVPISASSESSDTTTPATTLD